MWNTTQALCQIYKNLPLYLKICENPQAGFLFSDRRDYSLSAKKESSLRSRYSSLE